MNSPIKLFAMILIVTSVCSFNFPSRSFRRYNTFSSSNSEDVSDPLQQLLIYFDCAQVNPEDISDLLLEIGTLSVGVEVKSEYSDFLNNETRWEELGQQRSWATALLCAIFPSTFDSDMMMAILEEAFPQVTFEIEIKDVENLDWISHVQQSWKPQIIGDLTVRFPWHENETLTTSEELILEGGAAFGTGDHPTTRLCFHWLHQLITTADKTKDIDVLDYGCGSAILGLAALKYGATYAAGVDIDKDALISANNNCNMNNLRMDLYFASSNDNDCNQSDEELVVSMSILKGGATKTTTSSTTTSDSIETAYKPLSDMDNSKVFEVVVANILAPILISLAPSLASRTKSGGLIALSGIVVKQTEAVITAYEKYFNDVKVVGEEDGWVLISGVRR